MSKLIFIKILLLILITVPVLESFSQNRVMRRADRDFEKFRFSSAIERYQTVLENDPSNERAVKRLGDSYRLTNDPENAEKWYAKAIQFENIEPIYYFHYAQALRSNQNYEKARIYYGRYADLNPEDTRGQRLYDGMGEILDLISDSIGFEVENIGINTESAEFSPAFYQENGLVFPSSRAPTPSKRRADSWTDQAFLDLYLTRRLREGGYSEPELLTGEVNQRYHEGPLTFTNEYTEMYFTRNFYQGRRTRVSQEGIMKLEVFHAILKDGKWEVQGPVFGDVEYSTAHPTLTEDGKTMYFSSDMPGGFGGGDLYVVHKNEDGEWGEPENLGESLNTEGDEVFPFIHPDGTLYFASDGRVGLGGLDIYRAVPNGDGSWEVTNLGPPINSSGDDFGIIKSEDKKWGYFSSNRQGGKGDDDIYRFNKLIEIYIEILVLNRLTELPIDSVLVNLINKETGDIVEKLTGEEGIVSFRLKADKEYEITTRKSGYTADDELTISTVDIDTSTNLQKVISMGRLIAGEVFQLRNIYYDFDRYNIRPDAALVLDKLVEILKEYPEIHIELQSHTDSRGTDAYNMVLSNNRARSAVDYLIKKGIDRERLTFRGFGERKLVNDCAEGVPCSEAEHQLNRRTEFEITKGLE